MNIKKIVNYLTLLLLFFYYTLSAQAEESLPPEFTQFVQLFKQQNESTVDFKEEKYASYLDQPLRSSGEMHFSAPDKLSKLILKPEFTSQKISGDQLEIKTPSEVHNIDLKERPEFSVILRALIALLAGDQDFLQQNFKIKYNPLKTSWSLLLTPNDSYVAGYVESIKISGKMQKLVQIIITEPNNDKTITDLFNHR
ncbi:MAG: outer membrane lipoprotein carrier protein LolA [Gammaproteobacteria bacterium]|nr:outer membrane lipoprotein carrier protein LolA [Gammaproteobacteria bacterium]